MKATLLILFAALLYALIANADAEVAASVEKAMLGDHRSEENRARNQYRHPVGTLTFLGLSEGMTVMEIWPGGGWYTEVLAPAIRGKGQFVVAGYDVDVEGQPGYRYELQETLLEKFQSNPELYDQVAVVPFSPPQSASLGETDSIDMVLTFRNTHGWINDGLAESIFAEFARVLKPGGILGVVQHRGNGDGDPAETAESGYVSEAAMIELAGKAGLYLEARSEVNANPSDDHDHEMGVWSLPPGFRMCRDIEDAEAWAVCAEPWKAIGESDRMTLRFRKPLG